MQTILEIKSKIDYTINMKAFHSSAYDKLTTKQQKAIDTYVENGFNIKDASAKSGYSEAALRSWLKTEKARICLKEYTVFLLDNEKDTMEYKIINTYMTRAFYNPADIIDADGFLIVDDLKSLGPLACCVDGIETEIKGFRKIKEESVPIIKKKVKLADREKALEQLSRYIQIMTDKIELSGASGGPLELYKLTRAERKQRIKDLQNELS